MQILKRFDKIKALNIFFWLIICFVVLTIPLVLYLDCKDLIPTILSQKNSNIFSDSIYSNSLAFVFSIIGFLVAVIIFLIRYISSKYHTEELETPPVFITQFEVTLAALCFFIIFNFAALFFELTHPHTLISIVFSLLLIFLIFTTILFAYYNTKVSTVLGMMSDDTIKFIKTKKSFKSLPMLGEIGYDDKFITDLNKKTSIFIKNSTAAIKNNQDTIFKSSLDKLNKITLEYLKQSKHIHATGDKFLDGLNNQFNFLVEEALKNSNQEFLEDIANTLGTISIEIIKKRPGIGNINNLALNWAYTLKDLFIQAYSKDRTIVCHLCLQKINGLVIQSLEEGYYRSYDTYRMFLDEISESLSKLNARWSAILLQKALLMYQFQFLKFLELAKEDKIAFNERFINEYFTRVSNIINTAKKTHTTFGSRAVIFASLYGLETFSQKIAKTDLTQLSGTKVRRNVTIYLEQFIEFNKKMIEETPDKNDERVYDYFSETLFLISAHVDLEETNKKKLIEKLSNNLIEVIQEKYVVSTKNKNNHLSGINEAVIDYFAILICLHRNDQKLINNFIQEFIKLYTKIKCLTDTQSTERTLNYLYRKIKLFSCWIDLFDNLKEVNSPLIKLLKKDFYTPTFPHRISIPSLFEKYGYPTNTISRLNDLWYLHPSYMWGTVFQDKIAKILNADNGQHYKEFHEMLKDNKQ